MKILSLTSIISIQAQKRRKYQMGHSIEENTPSLSPQYAVCRGTRENCAGTSIIDSHFQNIVLTME